MTKTRQLISDDKNYDEIYAASSLTRGDGTKLLFEDHRTFKIHPIYRFLVTSQYFIATIFVSESQLRNLSVYGHSSHNYQRKINETLPEDARNMLCCNNSRQKNPELQFYSIPKRLDRRNKLLASIRRHHWQLTYGQNRIIRDNCDSL